jgi:hypothetical protein
VKSIDEIFYPLQEDGTYDFLTPRETANNPPYPVLLEDATTGEEDWSGLG